jgi:hypothetical protein
LRYGFLYSYGKNAQILQRDSLIRRLLLVRSIMVALPFILFSKWETISIFQAWMVAAVDSEAVANLWPKIKPVELRQIFQENVAGAIFPGFLSPTAASNPSVS